MLLEFLLFPIVIVRNSSTMSVSVHACLSEFLCTWYNNRHPGFSVCVVWGRKLFYLGTAFHNYCFAPSRVIAQPTVNHVPYQVLFDLFPRIRKVWQRRKCAVKNGILTISHATVSVHKTFPPVLMLSNLLD